MEARIGILPEGKDRNIWKWSMALLIQLFLIRVLFYCKRIESENLWKSLETGCNRWWS
jgi:hypothetical protein